MQSTLSFQSPFVHSWFVGVIIRPILSGGHLPFPRIYLVLIVLIVLTATLDLLCAPKFFTAAFTHH